MVSYLYIVRMYCRCRNVERHGIMSMMVLCNGIGAIEHDRRRLGLPNAPVVMENDNNRNTEI